MPNPFRAAPMAAAALLAACGSGSKDAPAQPPPAVGLPAVAAQERRARTLVRSGARPELGSEADAVFAELDQAWAGGLPAVPWAGAVPAAVRVPVRTPFATGPEIGDTVGSAMAGLLAALEPGLDPAVLNGRTGSKHADMPFGSADHSWVLQMAQSGSNLVVGIAARTTYTGKNGKRIEELVTGSAETQLCPDAEGKVPFRYTFTGSITAPGGATQFNLSGSGTATVDDDGGLAGWGSETTLRFAAQGGAVPVTGADALVHLTRTFDGAGDPLTSSRTVERDSAVGTVITAVNEIGNQMAPAMERYILGKAQARWQNGACLEVLAEGVEAQNVVAVSSQSIFTGKVRHRFEGVELAAPITAALAGGKTIAPAAATQAPVSYAYGAPDQEDQLSTVTLETRSRRGRDRTAVTFFTKALQAWGGTIAFSGTKVDPVGSQTLTWAGTATVRLVRTDVAGGGSTFRPDPASGAISFDVFTLDTELQRCGLEGRAVGGPKGILGGNLVVLTNPARYAFTLAVLAQGGWQCVDKSTGKATGTVVTPGASPTTSPGGGVDPGFRPVTDPSLLSGSAHLHLDEGGGAFTDQDTSWSLSPQ